MAISFFSSCTLSTLFQSVKPGVPLVFDRSPGTPRDGYLLSDRWCRSTVQTAEQIVSATIPCSVARRRITHATFGSGRLDSATFYRSVYLSSRGRSECQHIFHPFSQRAHSRRSNPFTPIHTPQRSIHYPAVFCWTSVESYLRTISVSVDRKFSHVKELELTMDYPFLCANRTSTSWPIPKYPKCVNFCEHFNLKYTNYHINPSLSMKSNLSTSKLK